MSASKIIYADKDDSLPVTDERRKFFDLNANEIKTVVNSHADELDSLQAQVDGLEIGNFKGVYGSYTDLVNANPTGEAGDWAQVDSGELYGVRRYDFDVDDGWVESHGNNIFPKIVTDADSISLDREYNRLTTSRTAITVAIPFIGAETKLELFLNGTDCVLTFPLGSYCTYNGTRQGVRTMTISGAVSGDRILIVTHKVGNSYYPIGLNMTT